MAVVDIEPAATSISHMCEGLLSSPVAVQRGEVGELGSSKQSSKPLAGCFRCLKMFCGRDKAREILQQIRGDWARNLKLLIELIFQVAAVFYIDFLLDIQALFTFWKTKDPMFFLVNLSAMVAAAVYNGVHMVQHGERLLGDLSGPETFLLGIAFVFQLHIVWLCWISWKMGKKHQLLIDSKFAEAAIEAVVSALVQTYAVVFRAKDLDPAEQLTLYISILGSLISISSAFTLFDSPTGIDEAPGNTHSTSAKLFFVWLFRLFELTSKLCCIALLQLATRPFGGAIFTLVDVSILALMVKTVGGQIMFAPPCVFALMNPMLETFNAVTVPHWSYYLLRLFELSSVGGILYWRFGLEEQIGEDKDGHAIWLLGGEEPLLEKYKHAMPVVYAGVLSTVGMILFLPIVRCFRTSGLLVNDIYPTAEWARKPFSRAQQKLRDDTLEASKQRRDPKDETLAIMLKPAHEVLDVCKHMNRMAYDQFIESLGQESTNQPLNPPPRQFMTATLHIMRNSPIAEKRELYNELMSFVLNALVQSPALMAEGFLRTEGIHAVADLVLKDCAMTTGGVQTAMPLGLCELFIQGGCLVLQHVEKIALQDLHSSALPRALAAATLQVTDQRREGGGPLSMDDAKLLIKSLSAVFSGKVMRDFSEEGLSALLRSVAALSNQELELRIVVPILLVQLIEDPSFLMRLPKAAATCAKSVVEVLRQLDEKIEAFGGDAGLEVESTGEHDKLSEMESQKDRLLRFSRDFDEKSFTILQQGTSACLVFLQKLAYHVNERDAGTVVGIFQPVIQKLLQSKSQERQHCAQQLRLLLGTRGNHTLLQEDLVKKVNPNTIPTGTGKPLLVLAAAAKHESAVKSLLWAGSSKLAVDGTGKTASHSLLESGSIGLLEHLKVQQVGTPTQFSQQELSYCSCCSKMPLLEPADKSGVLMQLEDGKCPSGHALTETTKPGMAPLNLGAWRSELGNDVVLRLQHGRLIASSLVGDELWSCDGYTIGEKYVLNRVQETQKSSHAKAAGTITGSDTKVIKNLNRKGEVAIESMDHIVVDGEAFYYGHWYTEGYEGEILFRGATVNFDGRGDSTRKSGRDQAAVIGALTLSSGMYYFEFTMHKVVCNVFIGLSPAEQGLEQKHTYHPSPAWLFKMSPQHTSFKIQAGKDMLRDKVPQEVKPDDVVSILLDMDQQVMAFFLNRNLIGSVIKNIPAQVRLRGVLDSEGDRFTVRQLQPPQELLHHIRSADGGIGREATLWKCTNCLTSHHIGHEHAVTCWACSKCNLSVCESCRLGIGPLPDGRTGLSLAAWVGTGVKDEFESNEDIDEEKGSCEWTIALPHCWSKKQVVEAFLVATLGDHPARISLIFEQIKSMPELAETSCQVGIFAGGSLNVAPLKGLDIVRLALHVALATSRPRALKQLLIFEAQLQAESEDSPKNESEVPTNDAKTPPKSGVNKQVLPWSVGNKQVFPKGRQPGEPWFENMNMPRLVVLLNSYCVTARILQRHQHQLFAYPAAGSRACSSCGFQRAAMFCDTCDFALCTVCTFLVDRTAHDQLKDCTHSIKELLSVRPESLKETLPGKPFTIPPQVGDLMLRHPTRDPSLLTSQLVKVVSINSSGKPITEPVQQETSDSAGQEEAEEEKADNDDDGIEEEGDHRAKIYSYTVDFTNTWQKDVMAKFEEIYSHEFRKSGFDTRQEFFDSVAITDRKGTRVIFDELMKFSVDAARERLPVSLKYTAAIQYRAPVPAISFSNGCSAFHFAAALVHENPMRKLLKHAQSIPLVDVKVDNQESQLEEQSDIGKVSLFEMSGQDKNTPLHVAAVLNRPKQVTELLTAKADPSPQNDKGHTPLMLALKFQSEEVTARLIDAVQKIDAEGERTRVLEMTDSSKQECTVMHYAVFAGHIAVSAMQQVLQAGALPAPLNKAKRTPLMLAVGARNKSIVNLLLQPEVSWRTAVLDSLSQQDVDGNDALMMAINDNSIEIMTTLLKAGANCNAKKTQDKGAEIKQPRVPLTMAKSVAAVSAICNALKGTLDLKVGEESVLAGMLAKRKGQSLAERLLEQVGQEKLAQAAVKTNNAKELEFLLHHVSADNINASDKQREELQKKLVVGVQTSVLSEALVRSVHRKDCFGGTGEFLLSSGADIKEALRVSITKSNMTMLNKFLAGDWLQKSLDVLRAPKSAAAEAARACENKFTLEAIAQALMGPSEWAKVSKQYKASGATGQMATIQRMVRDGLQPSSKDAGKDDATDAAKDFASTRPETNEQIGQEMDDSDDYDYDGSLAIEESEEELEESD